MANFGKAFCRFLKAWGWYDQNHTNTQLSRIVRIPERTLYHYMRSENPPRDFKRVERMGRLFGYNGEKFLNILRRYGFRP